MSLVHVSDGRQTIRGRTGSTRLRHPIAGCVLVDRDLVLLIKHDYAGVLEPKRREAPRHLRLLHPCVTQLPRRTSRIEPEQQDLAVGKLADPCHRKG
jgi:hypothetical protein